MGDMLIRGIDPELKRRIEESARRNGRSLSEEAIAAMQKSYALQDARTDKAGNRLVALAGGAVFTQEELAALEASRHEADRAPPNLD